jgi:hypothetical protein
VTNQVGVSWIGETCGLAAVDSLSEGAMEEDILHIELLNQPVMGESSGEHCARDGRFHNWTKSLVVVDSGALSETPKDPASLVATEGPVSAELVCEDPFASDDVGALRSWNKVPCPITHQGPYSSSIAARQLGSARTAQTEDGIGDGVGDVVVGSGTVSET